MQKKCVRQQHRIVRNRARRPLSWSTVSLPFFCWLMSTVHVYSVQCTLNSSHKAYYSLKADHFHDKQYIASRCFHRGTKHTVVRSRLRSERRPAPSIKRETHLLKHQSTHTVGLYQEDKPLHKPFGQHGTGIMGMHSLTKHVLPKTKP